MNKKELLKDVKKHKTSRINLFELNREQIKYICNVYTEEIRKTILNSNQEDSYLYQYDWVDRSKPTFNDNKEIKKLENIIDKVHTNLNKFGGLKITKSIRDQPFCLYSTNNNGELLEVVKIPKINRFRKSKYYYRTLIHELSHVSTSKNHLNIKCDYDEEEICVETVAVIILNSMGYNIWKNSISYMINRSYSKHEKNRIKILTIKTKRQWKRIELNIYKILIYILGLKFPSGTKIA